MSEMNILMILLKHYLNYRLFQFETNFNFIDGGIKYFHRLS